jgi:hypothetical protein
MLMLTEDAAEVTWGLAEAPGAAGLHITPTPPVEGPGPAFEVEVAAGADTQDDVLEAGGARIFLAPGLRMRSTTRSSTPSGGRPGALQGAPAIVVCSSRP